MEEYIFFVYIVTNPAKKSLYIGVTNNLVERLDEHYQKRGNDETWAGKYYCYKLIYYETFKYIDKAIEREKQLKGWTRAKKEFLIKTMNPNWDFLNDQFKRDPSVEPRSKKSE